MIYNFYEKIKHNDWLENELQSLKKDYQKPQMTEEQLKNLQKKMKEAGVENMKRGYRMIKFTASAALIVGFMALPNTSATIAHAMGQIPVIGRLVEAVTFRDYKYESDRNMANVKIPELKVDGYTKKNKKQEKLLNTTEEINAEIQKITDKLVKEFEESIEQNNVYQNIEVNSEIVATTDDYFTLKLNCYQAAGSGYEFNYYYTIDLNNGERLYLKDIFKDGVDYITPISKNIKQQMKQQMDADENIVYWLENDIDEWNLKKLQKKHYFT